MTARTSLVRCLALVACLLPLAVQAYSASVFTRANAGVAVIGAPGSTEHLPPDRSASTTTKETLTLGNDAYALTTNAQCTVSATGSAFASVSPGLVSVKASGQGTGAALPPTYSQSDSTGYGYASGGFTDSMTLSVSGVAPGTLVWVDFAVRFEGVSGVNRTAVAGGWGKGGGDYHWLVQVTSAGWGAGTLFATRGPRPTRWTSMAT